MVLSATLTTTLTTVGGAFLSSFLNVLFDRMASREFLDFFRPEKIEQYQEEVMSNLRTVNLVLDDAEDRQIRNPEVKKWLEELKDVMYAAGDLLDEFDTEVLRLKVEAQETGKHNKVVDSVEASSSENFGKIFQSELKHILDQLKRLVSKKEVLDLKEGVKDRSLVRIPATSLVEEDGVYGRNEDREQIIKHLLSNNATGNKIEVLPIVGMGGIGKTTLAQLVYNDKRTTPPPQLVSQKKKKKVRTTLDSGFHIRAWVCVSEEFDVLKITQTIHGSVITNQTCGTIVDLNLLQVQLKKALAGKKFLIVLDDVWSENYDLWDVLMRPFQSGAQGSRIIVTTRNQGVASMMGTLPTHHLRQLCDDDCWKVFANHAFANARSPPDSEREVIGREIVRKCKGLPLAAKSLGALLRSEFNLEEWEKILVNDIWELSAKETNILPALWLSYQYLSSDLKRCFAYCSIFPKGYEFRKSEMVSLWMAEDLLQPERKKKIEEVGEKYFDALISRSFFQLSSACCQSIFTMHDLINDLAKFVLGEFSVRLEDYDSLEFPNRIRHLSYLKAGVHEFEFLGCLLGTKNLHTLLPLPLQLPTCGKPYIPTKLHRFALAKLKYLRVLVLSNYKVGEFLRSVIYLKHLRYLDLSRTAIDELPEQVCTLYNLQTLLLLDCKELAGLPEDLGRRLINLRRLDIRGSKINKIPNSVAKLRDLQIYCDFVLVVDASGKNIEKLKQPLVGKSLCISELTKTVLQGNALQANMISDKIYLKHLALSWVNNAVGSDKDEEVLKKLEPHSNLTNLTIASYRQKSFPGWLGDPTFCNLTSVILRDCKYCERLPPMGQLPSLIQLCIEGLEAVKSIGAEFFGSPVEPFRSLKVLSIINMKQWQNWSYAGGIMFANLCSLHLHICPELIGMLELDNMPKLESLELLKLEQFTGSLSQSKCLPSLYSLDIRGCPNFKCFPDEKMPRLLEMRILKCTNLLSLPDDMNTFIPLLQNMIIQGCPELESFPKGGLPSKLKTLEFDCHPKLFQNRSQWDLPKLNLLRSLKVSFPGCGRWKWFPLEAGLLPVHLTSLSIFNLDITEMKSKDFEDLNSLEKLFIGGCSNLKHLPRDGLPASLSHLGFEDCPSLMEGFDMVKRKNWPQLVDIPLLTFDGIEVPSDA